MTGSTLSHPGARPMPLAGEKRCAGYSTQPRARLMAEIDKSRRCVNLRERCSQRARRRLFVVEWIEPLETSFRVRTLKAGLFGVADGAHIGNNLADHLSGIATSADGLSTIDLPDLGISVFPYVTAITSGFKEGRYAWSGQASWGTAALNTTVAASSVAGGSTIGAALGSAVLPGAGTFIGGAIGGWFGGVFGKAFAERKVTSAIANYKAKKESWEQRLESSRIATNDDFGRYASALQDKYNALVPRPSWSSHMRLTVRCGAWQAAAALLRPLDSMQVIQKMQTAAVARIATANARLVSSVREEQRLLQRAYRRWAEALETRVNNELTRRGELVVAMFTELNGCYERLNEALLERGRGKR